MTSISKITVKIVTSNMDGAGTDGNVYLGLCGREFFLDSSGDDFEKNSNFTYVRGDGSTILNKDGNDPRKPQLNAEDLDKFPAYIRFEPLGGSNSGWNLKSVNVEVAGTGYGINYPAGIWLGEKAGKFCYLKKGRFGE